MAATHQALQVTVVSRSLTDPDIERKERRIDLRSTGDRAWLAKHQYWCMMNNRSVYIAPVELEA